MLCGFDLELFLECMVRDGGVSNAVGVDSAAPATSDATARPNSRCVSRKDA